MTRMPSPSAAAMRSDNASAFIIVPVGLAGLATTTPASGFLMRRQELLAGEGPPRLRSGLDQHRLAAERLQNVAIRRVAGIGERDAVTGLEQGEKREKEA